MSIFMYCLLTDFLKFLMLKLMFHSTIIADLIWSVMLCYFMEIGYRAFCLHGRILLDLVINAAEK